MTWPTRPASSRSSGDEAGLARALGLAGQLRFWAGEAASAIEDLERAAQHAHNAGDRLQEIQSRGYVLIASVNGPTPVESALQRAEQMRGQVEGDRRLQVTILRCQARLEAMQGSFDVARQLIAEATSLADELGLEVSAAGVQFDAGVVELRAGRPAAAERSLRPAVEALERMGNQGHFVTIAPVLVDALFAQGRGEEAAALIERVAEWAMAEDMDPQIGWRRVKAKLLAQRGEFANAERLAREAVELAGRTSLSWNMRAHSRTLPRSSAWPDARKRRRPSLNTQSVSTSRKATSTRSSRCRRCWRTRDEQCRHTSSTAHANAYSAAGVGQSLANR